jgi:hypothetical protein
MSKQATYPPLTETDLDPVVATPTGTVHILTVTVKTGDKFGISDSKLHIKNGDKVIWKLSPVGSSETPIIKFAGKVVKDTISGTLGKTDVSHEILKEIKPEPLSEGYSVFLKRGDKEIKLTYEAARASETSARDSDPPPPEPYLVVDDIGDPTTDPGPPCDHRWGHRKNRRDSK